MFDISKVRTELKSLVGWANPVDPTYSIVDATNQTSDSGRLFTDNPYVKIPFIKDTQDYVSISDVQFNDLLGKITNEAITSVLDRIFDRPDFIDRQLLYKNANNKVDVDALPSGFVGYRIIPTLENNYTFEITRDILEFEGTGNVTLLLYNSAKKTAVESQLVNITSPLQEQQLGWKLDNTDSYFKGEYFYGYLTDSMAIQPVKRDYQAANVMTPITGLCVENIQAPVTGSDLFDLDDVDGASECWGLNPDFVVYDDFTDFIIQNKRLFAYAIQLQGQIETISIYLASLRSNKNERISNDYISRIMIELDGGNADLWNRKGLRSVLINEITRLREEVLKMQDGYFSDHQIISVTRS